MSGVSTCKRTLTGLSFCLAVGIAAIDGVGLALAQDVVPAASLEKELTRAIAVVPKFDSSGYTTPETSNFVSLNSVQFDLDSDKLTTTAMRQLDQVAIAVKNVTTRAIAVVPNSSSQSPGAAPSPSAGVKIVVEGHTCNLGTVHYNQELADRRARAAVEYLVAKGIDRSQLQARAWGQQRPVVPNTTEANRARNRRVDFVCQQSQSSLAAGSRGLEKTTTARMGYVDVTFEAIARSEGGKRYTNGAIATLRSGDEFKGTLKVQEGCHVYALMLDSSGVVSWLALDAANDDWLLSDAARSNGEYGVWCYYGSEHHLPYSTKFYTLDSNPGNEVLCVVASPVPVPTPQVLADNLKQRGGQINAQSLAAAAGIPNLEVHVLTINHE